MSLRCKGCRAPIARANPHGSGRDPKWCDGCRKDAARIAARLCQRRRRSPSQTAVDGYVGPGATPPPAELKERLIQAHADRIARLLTAEDA